MNKIDLIGKKYGRLDVISQGETKHKPNGAKVIFWTCMCECGTQKDVSGEALRDGRVKSCGCKRAEVIGGLNLSHGMSNSREYKSWQHIKYRCLNKNAAKYPDYGGRGITICERWINSFENFYKDMGNAPFKHTIDRINVNMGYSKDNCKWSTKKEQSSNTRNNVIVNMDGKNMILKDACDLLGLQYNTVRARIKKLGWSTERALNLI